VESFNEEENGNNLSLVGKQGKKLPGEDKVGSTTHENLLTTYSRRWVA
jgi:hypothetical protein